MDDRSKYRELCERETSIPIFSRAWWLDAVAGADSWDVALVERDGEIAAAMPYVLSRRYGIRASTHPPLTQTLGPWLRLTGSKPSRRLAQEKDLMQALVDRLPRVDYFVQNWHHARTNWLPFYWRKYEQTTRYTYILPDLSDEAKLWRGLQDNVRGDIKKASGRFGVTVRDDLEVADLLRLVQMTFRRQGLPLPYPVSVVHRIAAACAPRRCAKLFIGVDADGRHHAGALIVWDENSAYYLLGGGDPALRNSGATSLCLWEGVKHARTVTAAFDFEGSMLEPVERFFRAFGATQVPYHHITKTDSRLLKLAKCLRAATRGL